MTGQEVTIYTTPDCGISKQLEEFLAKKGITYKEVDVSGSPDLVAKLCNKADGQKTGPMIAIGDEIIAGFEPHTLETLLHDRFGK
jgi:glutaredoxin 3